MMVVTLRNKSRSRIPIPHLRLRSPKTTEVAVQNDLT